MTKPAYPQTPFPADGMNFTDHEKALLAPVLYWGRGVYLILAALGAVISFGAYAYLTQLLDGLAVTDLGDTVSWGLYITNFVFFIGISHVGALLSSILRLTGAPWRHPVTRMAEAITFSSLLIGGLMPIIDLGRPDRILNIFLYGRLQSPIIWDIVSIMTYLAGSTIFLLLPLIPDAALLRDKYSGAPIWRRWLYRSLAFGWRGSAMQRERLEHLSNIMAVLILPIAVMVHTVVSWIFAMTLRPGWNSTIFGPYFVAGALASGAASVIVAMAAFRKAYHLEKYVTLRHFRNMTALALVLDLAYIYFNLSEYLTLYYKMELAERGLLTELFSGSLAPLFWLTQILGLVLPAFLFILPHIKPVAMLRRVPILRPVPLTILVLVILGVAGVTSFGSRYLGAFDLTSILPVLRLLVFLAIGLWFLSVLPALQSRPIATAVIASVLVVVQAWLKRFLIIVPVFKYPFLSMNSPMVSAVTYQPTWVEWAITAAGIAGFLFVYFLFSRLFPIVSVWETAHDHALEASARRSSQSPNVSPVPSEV